jgi:DNA-binding MarR family transcriptional regulator
MKKRAAIRRSSVRDTDYKALAEFRYHIRRYLDFSDKAARSTGIEPKQYQLLLALKGLPENLKPTIGTLAEQLHTRHHSAVELVNRAEANKFVVRSREGSYVTVELTPLGERILERVVKQRLRAMHTAGPVLVKALQKLTKKSGRS